MEALALALAFATSAASDALACAWHRARERRAYAKGASLAGVGELVQWTPVLLALEANVPVAHVVIACVAGSIVGSAWGFRG